MTDRCVSSIVFPTPALLQKPSTIGASYRGLWMTQTVTQIGRTDFYNESYKRPNYFHYQAWIYEAYVSSLVAFCGLKKGASLLDAGCGQGFFSYQFCKNGLRVKGIDLSETGVQTARNQFGRLGISFSVADIQAATFSEEFDCIFVRSCSLYNTDSFPVGKQVTDSILRHLKIGGTFIFAYHSDFSHERPNWIGHSLRDVQQHFGQYTDAKTFFLNKITIYLLRTYAFIPLVTRLSIFLSKVSGIGGDLICIFRKTQPT